MSVQESRGGIPHVRRITADTTGREAGFKFPLKFLCVRNQGANDARLYFTKTDFDNDLNYVVIPQSQAQNPHGEWQGPVETYPGMIERQDIWFRSAAATTDLEIVGFQRRG